MSVQENFMSLSQDELNALSEDRFFALVDAKEAAGQVLVADWSGHPLRFVLTNGRALMGHWPGNFLNQGVTILEGEWDVHLKYYDADEVREINAFLSSFDIKAATSGQARNDLIKEAYASCPEDILDQAIDAEVMQAFDRISQFVAQTMQRGHLLGRYVS
ncbi:YfbM family protein [Yoonia sp. F2084L]|uniref:DUF1877 family protein n=1 Tax=Yoonia sp. F2084L TaxID=2926419 RepID=UPI001FF60C5C|nr:DUF1877 family protein [Yoonia sp. F2084L]MCK0094871.1 YfbM family protein [Yoonia sp. F2084L]